jgi:hypothetical protein
MSEVPLYLERARRSLSLFLSLSRSLSRSLARSLHLSLARSLSLTPLAPPPLSPSLSALYQSNNPRSAFIVCLRLLGAPVMEQAHHGLISLNITFIGFSVSARAISEQEPDLSCSFKLLSSGFTASPCGVMQQRRSIRGFGENVHPVLYKKPRNVHVKSLMQRHRSFLIETLAPASSSISATSPYRGTSLVRKSCPP